MNCEVFSFEAFSTRCFVRRPAPWTRWAIRLTPSSIKRSWKSTWGCRSQKIKSKRPTFGLMAQASMSGPRIARWPSCQKHPKVSPYYYICLYDEAFSSQKPAARHTQLRMALLIWREAGNTSSYFYRKTLFTFIPNSVFRRVRKIAKSDCWLRHVCPSVAWNNSAPTGRIFMKFDIFFESLSRKFKFY